MAVTDLNDVYSMVIVTDKWVVEVHSLVQFAYSLFSS